MTGDLGTPLTDAEVEELDRLLAAFPEERCPFDVAMLDGFLAGVLLAPDVVLPSAWLPQVLAADGGAIEWPDAATAERMMALMMRRHNELAAYLVAREPFDPIVFELTDDAGTPLAGKAGIPALAFWAGGFAYALDAIPSLGTLCDAVEISRPRRPATRGAAKVGRNEPCPCGSGKKYKACHGRADG